MTADVLSFEVGMRLLRGVDAEAERKARIKSIWVEARRRAFHAIVHTSDVGLFGRELLLEWRAPMYADRDLTILADSPAQTETAACATTVNGPQ